MRFARRAVVTRKALEALLDIDTPTNVTGERRRQLSLAPRAAANSTQ
ncbi:MAG: hypothetical protein ACLPVY_08935 [Acidimicrobiia bacterium]